METYFSFSRMPPFVEKREDKISFRKLEYGLAQVFKVRRKERGWGRGQ